MKRGHKSNAEQAVISFKGMWTPQRNNCETYQSNFSGIHLRLVPPKPEIEKSDITTGL